MLMKIGGSNTSSSVLMLNLLPRGSWIMDMKMTSMLTSTGAILITRSTPIRIVTGAKKAIAGLICIQSCSSVVFLVMFRRMSQTGCQRVFTMRIPLVQIIWRMVVFSLEV